MTAALDYPFIKLFNRVLSDYPMAREQLAMHAGKTIAVGIGPLDCRLRVAADGTAELIGEGGEFTPDVTFQVPPSLLPRLMQREESAYREVVFSGDSEFAALLSTLTREIEWDIEEDLSQFVGDIAAHRIVDTVRRTHEWRQDAMQRLTENIAEYLTEERRAFITKNDLETLSLANETLRDDVARLEARLGRLAASSERK